VCGGGEFCERERAGVWVGWRSRAILREREREREKEKARALFVYKTGSGFKTGF
jgi:hypothetical protein